MASCRTGLKVQNEKKAAERDGKLVRAKRNKNNLPDPWDTQWIKIQRNWKWQSKKRRQWWPVRWWKRLKEC